MSKQNWAQNPMNAAYVPALANAALEVLRRDGEIAFCRPDEKMMRMGFRSSRDPNAPLKTIEVTMHDHHKAAEMVARAFGDTKVRTAALPQETRKAFGSVFVSDVAGEIVRRQGAVTTFEFDREGVHFGFVTQQGEGHDFFIRPETRQQTIREIMQTIGASGSDARPA